MKKMKQISIGKIMIGIFTVILTISLIAITSVGISELMSIDSSPYGVEEEDYISALQHEDYVELLDMASRDTKPGKSHSQTIRSCQAVGHYYEAASLYKAYLVIGNTKAAGVQVQRMEQYASQTAEFADYVEKINDLLEIDETV